MPLSCKCPGCQQVLTVPDSAGGKQVKCPKCSTVLAIAAPKQAPKPQAAAPQTRPAAAGQPASKPVAQKAPAANQSAAPQGNRPAQSAAPAGGVKPVACPKCKQIYKVSPENVGKKLKCKKCQAIFIAGGKKAPAKTPQPVGAGAAGGGADDILSFSDVAPVDQTASVGASEFGGGDTGGWETTDTAVAPSGDPFGGADDLGSLGAGGGGSPFDQPAAAAPSAGASFGAAGGGFAAPQPNAAAPAKAAAPASSTALTNEVIYKLPAILGFACAGMNLVIVLLATGLGCVAWFPRFKAIGLIIFIAGTTIGAQIHAINGFWGVLKMVDRHGGIFAAKGILACPFITAIVLGLGLGPFGIFIAAIVWVFMLAYNWPIGWWLWLKLEKDECARHFGEVTHNDADVSALLSGKKKSDPEAAAPTAAWSPAPQKQPAAGEEPAKKTSGMSAKTRSQLFIAGGVLAGLVVIGGIVGIGATLVMSGGEPGDPIPEAPPGYFAATLHGATVFMPAQPQEPEVGLGDMDCLIATSPNDDALFVFGASISGPKKQDTEGLGKNTGRRLGGDMMGPREHSRNGYEGIVGRLATSFKFPDMQIEVFQHDGRTVLFGVSSGGGIDINNIPDPEIIKKAKEEKDTFLDSLHIGKLGTSMFGL